MPDIPFRWYDEQQTILYEVFPNKWELNDFYLMLQNTNPVISSRQERVDIIMDFSQTSVIPTNMMSSSTYLDRHTPPNLGVTVVIVQSLLMERFLKIVSVAYPKISKSIRVTSSINQALQVISKIRDEEQKS